MCDKCGHEIGPEGEFGFTQQVAAFRANPDGSPDMEGPMIPVTVTVGGFNDIREAAMAVSVLLDALLANIMAEGKSPGVPEEIVDGLAQAMGADKIADEAMDFLKSL